MKIFQKKDNALIAITELENIEELIPKIIINDADVDKKGRNALINPEYTHIGISETEVDEEIYIILIFSKLIKKEEENKITIEEEASSCSLSDKETFIYEQIKQFKENPKNFKDKSVIFNRKKKKKSDYEDFIKDLDKMPEIKPHQDLCDIAKEEIKKFSEAKDNEYVKYQIGDNFKIKLNENFSEKNNALIAITELENLEELIPKIIITIIPLANCWKTELITKQRMPYI